MKKGIFSAVIFCLFFSFSTQATLVKTDVFTSGDGLAFIDSSTNLEWLNLTQTASMSVNEALSLFPDWTVASFAQVTSLFDRIVPDYAPSTPTGVQSGCLPSTACAAQGEEWLDTFGRTNTYGASRNLIASYAFGLYSFINPSNGVETLRLAGTRTSNVNGQTLLIGTNFTSNYNEYRSFPNSNFPYISTYLVRNAAVSPSQNVLLASAPGGILLLSLVGILIFMRRK